MIKKFASIILPSFRLPAYELNHSPRIIVAYESDFFSHIEMFLKVLPQKVTIILQLGWTLRKPDWAITFFSLLDKAKCLFPEARFIVLANDPLELDVLKPKTEAYFCNHNAFLDPQRYPLAGKERKYDAIYVARITPFKRHHLAQNVKSLRLIGDHSARETKYFSDVMTQLPNAIWTRKIPSYRIGRAIGQARCGLALSEAEGAMFVAGEYSLCGLPIVNTKNIGGRDFMIPGFSVFMAKDTTESVAEGVEYWENNNPDPAAIREDFLRKAKNQRDFFSDLLFSIAQKRIALPHKLGIRCGITPRQALFHGITKP